MVKHEVHPAAATGRFVRLRETLAARKELFEKLAELESRIDDHDESIHALFEAIHRLMGSPERKRRRIGFGTGNP